MAHTQEAKRLIKNQLQIFSCQPERTTPSPKLTFLGFKFIFKKVPSISLVSVLFGFVFDPILAQIEFHIH